VELFRQSAIITGGKMKKLFLSIAMTIALFVSAAPAQTQASASGHWEGSIDVPGTALEFAVDLTRNDKGLWKAILAIPSQNLKDFPLINVKVDGATISFEMTSTPGEPTFKGKLSADGKTIAGELSQAGQTFPFKLDRKGDSKLSAADAPAPLIKVSADVEGNWQGILDVGGTSLRLILKIAKAADGTFTAKLDSPDQGNSDLPITALTATADSLTFEMKYVSATYQGKFNQERTEVSGTWEQGGGSMPLTLKREAKKKP
jgi:hypothetical protein